MVQSWNLLRTQNKVTSLGAPQNKPKEASRLVSPMSAHSLPTWIDLAFSPGPRGCCHYLMPNMQWM